MTQTSSPWPGNCQGAVSLTFDDGAQTQLTTAIPILNKFGLQGSFYLNPRDGYEEKLAPWKEVAAAGHEIGNHTWRHRNAWLLSPGAAAREITEGARILAEIVGAPPRLYRPPWGIVSAASLATARRLGLTTVLWSVQHEGLRPRPPDAQLRHVASRL